MSTKTAIVVFNMGGPDSLVAVQPFLRNLFADPAIIHLPNPFRQILAEIISRSRAGPAQKNYAKMGGSSPLLPQSRKQAQALQSWLAHHAPQTKTKCFVAMRYWHPKIREVQEQVKAWGAHKIILLPLYPQFSTTTTGTFITAWQRTGRDLAAPHIIRSYATNADFIAAHVRLILESYRSAGSPENTRLIFSAHGLPQKIVDAGDPYANEVENTCAAIAAHLPEALQDNVLAYQSRVGPLKWLGPYTLEALARAGRDGKAVLLAPVAFVSEHVETLVELDIDYRARAQDMGVERYVRVPALGTAPEYIKALGRQVLRAMQR